MKLHSYNQMVAIYGKEDEQVKRIDEYIKLIGDCVENRTLEAFKRVEAV